MQGNLIDQGLELMLYGMGTVMVFLTLLVLVTMLMSALVQRFLPEEAPLSAAPAPSAAADATVLAVISAAIHQHRKNRRLR